MTTRPTWEDATSYSRNGDRTPTAFRIKISRDVVITITHGHIYHPGEWVFHCRPWFDTYPLDLSGLENQDEAKSRAIALVRAKINALAATMREVN